MSLSQARHSAEAVRDTDAVSEWEPDRLEFRIGGYMPFSSTSIEWANDTLVFRDTKHVEGEPDELAILKPSAKRWKAFWRTLDDLGAWQWRESYTHEHVITDGFYWSLEIAWQSRELRSGGENGVPPSAEIDYSPEFRRLLRALERLMTPEVE